jgi:murein DD-endopeptidase MepM/ murein hydrolase activator NlpD
LGTDFAAPTGTPIRSVGDGIVQEAQYKRNNGNYVKIRHNGTYTTQYLHMSKIAPGIKPGVRVRQGQWIGNVGSTGLATGPHVCYRFWKNGVQVDALRVELPPSEPITEAYLEAYNAARDAMIEKLNAIPSVFPNTFASAL